MGIILLPVWILLLENKQALNNLAQPMEKRGIHWAITFGNHDEDSTAKSGLDEEAMLKFYMSYPHNLNKPSEKGITGTGNSNILIQNSKGNKPAFNVWLMDSGRYASRTSTVKILKATQIGTGYVEIK